MLLIIVYYYLMKMFYIIVYHVMDNQIYLYFSFFIYIFFRKIRVIILC
jgi:hypothetical protein